MSGQTKDSLPALATRALGDLAKVFARLPAGAEDALSSAWTSHAACAKKARSRAPARNWGRPKRWRVKNRVIRQDEVFYHERACLRESSAMNDLR